MTEKRNYVHPHFLFNGFYILKHQIQDRDWEGANDMADHLASYFQYITRNGKQIIELQAEWEHCLNYLAIQKERFGFRLTVIQDMLPDDLKKIPVPRLILQPLLENAMSHGTREQTQDAIVSLCCHSDGKNAVISVADNGNTLNDEALTELRKKLGAPGSEITALINIHQRLCLQYGAESGLELKRSDLGGLEVSMKIPIVLA